MTRSSPEYLFRSKKTNLELTVNDIKIKVRGKKCPALGGALRHNRNRKQKTRVEKMEAEKEATVKVGRDLAPK